VSQNLTTERTDIAFFWADGPGTVTPPGHWNQIGADMGVAAGFNEPRMARMMAALGVAQADAFVACWDCKYAFDCVRPITEIRDKIDPLWTPIVGTPPFPTYTSGHSSTSGAASQLLGFFFPADAVILADMGTEAMNSRLYGGIHFTFDNEGGLDLGRSIATRVLGRIATDGAD
jgi:hypothetical protein